MSTDELKSIVEFEQYDTKIVDKEDHYGLEASYKHDGQTVGIGAVFQNEEDARSGRRLISSIFRSLDPNMAQRMIDRDIVRYKEVTGKDLMPEKIFKSA